MQNRKIARENVRTFLGANGNKLFGATFIKVDGSERKMTARLGVKKNLRGGMNRVVRDDRSYMTVFDMQKNEYRTLNLRTLKELRIKGKRYQIV